MSHVLSSISRLIVEGARNRRRGRARAFVSVSGAGVSIKLGGRWL